MKFSEFSTHSSSQFNEELNEIRSRVMEMGGLVEQHVCEAVKSFMEGDSKLAQSLAEADYRVNSMEVAIDEECSKVLALRQPVAGDLRLIVMVIKTITDLERIGDEAEKIARLSIKLGDSDMPKSQFRVIGHLCEHVKRILKGALDAHARMDVAAALSIIEEDLVVDEEYEGAMRQLMTFMMEDPRHIKRILDVIWCARALERIGDHAKNICEYVVYMVEGKDVRHISIEDIQKKVNIKDG